ncbi:MAG: tRNA (adenosine(37)-N6)-dimethylallyltransferase MiaA [Chthoniobacterales bacterium]
MFYIVGPTATGKSELAAEVARACGGEIVSADAFQVYRGLDLLTAKPEPAVLRAVPHHLIGTVPLAQRMDAEQFRSAALAAVAEIEQRGKPVFVVGGSGMYVQALTHGLSQLPKADEQLRGELDSLTTAQMLERLEALDAEAAAAIDRNNRRRILRALEICLLSGGPVSAQRTRVDPAQAPAGVLLLRERDELYERIDARVKGMFARDVVEEVRAADVIGPTAAQTIGLRQIQELIAGAISEAECIAQIQRATRRYAKRQLTWFQRQTNFEPLNLSLHGSSEAVAWIARKVRLSFTPQDD